MQLYTKERIPEVTVIEFLLYESRNSPSSIRKTLLFNIFYSGRENHYGSVVQARTRSGTFKTHYPLEKGGGSQPMKWSLSRSSFTTDLAISAREHDEGTVHMCALQLTTTFSVCLKVLYLSDPKLERDSPALLELSDPLWGAGCLTCRSGRQ